ncbi:hypothetical protein ACWCQK_42410, partial [Streptomyces sp. NPDC002306]
TEATGGYNAPDKGADYAYMAAEDAITGTITDTNATALASDPTGYTTPEEIFAAPTNCQEVKCHYGHSGYNGRVTPGSNGQGWSESISTDVGLMAADMAVRIICGGECGTANAPTTSEEAENAPKSLTAAQHAKNAYTTATTIYGKPTDKIIAALQNSFTDGMMHAGRRGVLGDEGPTAEERSWMRSLARDITQTTDHSPNCGLCAIALDQRFTGADPSAVAGFVKMPMAPVQILAKIGLPDDRYEGIGAGGYSAVADRLKYMGEGSRALMLVAGHYGQHWINGIVRNGNVIYADGYMGGRANIPVWPDVDGAIFLAPGEKLNVQK